MNRVVRHAIDCGCDPLIAIQMATINTACHFGMERELGSITPGVEQILLSLQVLMIFLLMLYSPEEVVAENGKATRQMSALRMASSCEKP